MKKAIVLSVDRGRIMVSIEGDVYPAEVDRIVYVGDEIDVVGYSTINQSFNYRVPTTRGRTIVAVCA